MDSTVSTPLEVASPRSSGLATESRARLLTGSTTGKWILLGFILALLLGLSFGAGFLIANQARPAPIVIEKCSK
ncbi:MAG: hypothetical protein AAB503_01420 [Patescibacteria group bacterium]